MKDINVKLTFIEPVLGSSPSNEDLYYDYVGSKAPDATTIEDEVESLGVDGVVEKGMTIFPKNEEGKRVTCTIRVLAVPENVLQLPAFMTEVGEEAFRATAAEYVVIPENTLSIGDYAFADSSSLILVEFHNGNTEIAEHAFDQCGLLRVIAPAGGTVEQFANAAQIPFVPLE